MTPEEILKLLKKNDVEVSVKDGGLHIRALGAPLSDELRSLIKANKNQLIEEISSRDVTNKKEVLKNENTNVDYKEYLYPTGEKIRLSREDFMSIVEVFTMLLDQETKLLLEGKQLNAIPREHEMFELDRTTPQTKNLIK